MESPLSLLVIRVSNLNELAGQNTSHINQVLAGLGEAIKHQVRETDLLARYCDNGFIALLPDTGLSAAFEVRSRIREAINNSELSRNLSVAIGMAASPQDGTKFEDLLQAAQIDCAASFDGLADLTTFEFGRLATSRPV
jgi:diguanylate cyclase (GGDEF)-like protein